MKLQFDSNQEYRLEVVKTAVDLFTDRLKTSTTLQLDAEKMEFKVI